MNKYFLSKLEKSLGVSGNVTPTSGSSPMGMCSTASGNCSLFLYCSLPLTHCGQGIEPLEMWIMVTTVSGNCLFIFWFW